MGIGEGVNFDTRESKKKLRGSFLLLYIKILERLVSQ